MDSQENNAEGILLSLRRPAVLFALLIIGLQIVVSILSYPFLPDKVPIHWNITGEVNGYASKEFNALFVPALSIGLYILLRILVRAGPRLDGRESQRSTLLFLERIMPALLLLFLALQLITIVTALNMPVDVVFVVNLMMALLFIYLGNYMGKLRRNFWAGIRTPWTLASNTVWERTHRLGGWLFVVTGILGLIMSFMPVLRVWGMAGALLVVVLVLFIYSYVIYHRLEAGGQNPLSPPFDS